MEMYQSEAVAHTFLIKKVESLEELGACQSELRGIATTLFPFAGTGRGQLDSDTDIRLDIHLLCHLCNDVELVELLNNDEYPFTHLLCQ